jgi:hypothetical protein
MRIIFVPQYPTPMRYQQWWLTEFPKEFEKAGFEVLILGKSYYEMICKIVENMDEDEPNIVKGNFAPLETAVSFECKQISQYMNIELRDDDILFLADISFPGLFGNILFHKRPKRCFAYCHATSINKLDYFEKDKGAKFPIESSHACLMDTVFVGSNYHEDKLFWSNTLVTRLPYPPLETFHSERKENLIVSASRPTAQKVDIDMECRLEEKFKYPIVREAHNSWEDYYKFLSKSKILLITSFEDTFGYQIVDAILNGCIPLAPTRCAYPEILPSDYLYNDEDELISMIDYTINNDDVPAPELLCHEEMENFYSNIIQVMKGKA